MRGGVLIAPTACVALANLAHARPLPLHAIAISSGTNEKRLVVPMHAGTFSNG